MNQRTIYRLATLVFILSGFQILNFRVQAQTNYGTQLMNTVIEGTSNIHDWELISPKAVCTMQLTMDPAGKLTAIGNVQYVIQVNTLKSKHGSQMDNNAYKAMDAEDHPTIRFTGTTGTVKSSGGNAYVVTVPGKLNISSGTRDVVITATLKVNADKSFSIDGTQKLKTTDYNVKAISIMLGAIKTSPDVTIKYSMNVKPQ
jgi:ribosomal protein L21E